IRSQSRSLQCLHPRPSWAPASAATSWSPVVAGPTKLSRNEWALPPGIGREFLGPRKKSRDPGERFGLPSTSVGIAMNDSFAEFLARLQARDDTAAEELFERFAGRLIALARRRCAPGLQHKVDPESVVQSAYKSFFHRYDEGKFDLGGWDSLWGLLTVITVHKCAQRVAYYRAECRDPAREASAPPPGAGASWR